MSWAERIINWQFELLADHFGEWPALIIMWILPPLCWAAITYYFAGMVWSVLVLVLVAIFWAILLIIVGSREIKG